MPRFVSLPSIYPPNVHTVARESIVNIDPHAYTVPTQGAPLAGSSVHLSSGLVLHVAMPPEALAALVDPPTT